MQKTSIKEPYQLIHKVGFHNNKANFINRIVGVLIRDYECDIPCNTQDMQKLAGVRRKMSYILEHLAFDRCTGIGNFSLFSLDLKHTKLTSYAKIQTHRN